MKKIWKGSRVMATDVDCMEGSIVVLWHQKSIDLLEWRANNFSLMANFKFLETGAKGTLVNVYGPSTFPQKSAFLCLLNWMKGITHEGKWIIGGYYNLIFFLRENKGSPHVLEKFQEEFREFLSHSPLVDVETGDGWFTWNNKRGGRILFPLELTYSFCHKT